MKSILLAVALCFSGAALANQPQQIVYDREYAYLTLLDMGYGVAPEEIGEMFKHNVFILVNSDVCHSLGAELYDNSGESCLMQVQQDGSIWGWHAGDDTSLYD
jgi:hypothetical protein